MTPIYVLAAEEAHNPLLPTWYDIFWSAVCFVIIFVAFWKYILPKFTQILDERSTAIEGGIEKAERVQAEADAALADYQKQLAEGRAEAARLRAEAQEDGAQIIAEMKQKASEEADRILAHAKVQIETERLAASVQLRHEIGGLATDLASKIVGEHLADDAKTAGVVDRFIAELEADTSAQPAEEY